MDFPTPDDCGAIRSRRSSRPAIRRSFPTCAVMDGPTSLPRWRHIRSRPWRAAVAWGLGALAGDRVDHLVALSVGHPATFRAGGFEQYEKSWYMLLFQFTGVAEEWLSANSWANFRAWSRHPDADAVIGELEAGSLTPGLNYYRA